MYMGDLFLNRMKTAKKKIITGNQLAYFIRNYSNPTVVYLGHAIFFSKKKCRAHDIISRAHDLLSRAHDMHIISCARHNLYINA